MGEGSGCDHQVEKESFEMLINVHIVEDLLEKIYFPVFQWELNHIAMLTKTASSSWETAEPMEKER